MASILYVDDDRSLCQIISNALRSEGYAVRTASDGDEALGALSDEPPDLLLIDLILPRRDGFDVLEQVRGGPFPISQLPAVLLTGCSPTTEYRDRAAALGAAALLTKPVALESLLDVVRAEIGEAKQPIPVDTSAEVRRAAPRTPALSGALDRLPLPALLHHLHGLRANGTLHLEGDRKRKWIQFRDGYPIAVRSNLIRECLGNYLVRTGRITEQQLEESRRRMGKGKLQGAILVAMDLLSPEEVSAALRAQAEAKLFEAFTWTTGSFHFEKGEQMRGGNAIALGRSPANLILQGVRHHFPLERIAEFLASNKHRKLALGESPFYRFQDVELDLAEQAFLYGLDGTRELAQFANAEESLRRTLFALVAVGLVELRDAQNPRAPRTADATPQPAAPSKAAARASAPDEKAAAAEEASPKANPNPAPARPVAARPVATRPRAQSIPAASPRTDAPRTPAAPRAEDAALRAELAKLAESFQGRSHFEVLGVAPASGEAELRDAYEALSQRTHPDRFAGCGEAVRRLAVGVHGRVAAAWETLSEPRRRAQYLLDQRREERESSQRSAAQKALEAETCFQRGEIELRQRSYEQALASFGRALQLYPDEGEYHAHYGWALHLCHPDDTAMIGEAIEHVRRGIKLAGDREKPYLFMGRLCKAMGRIGAAEKMFSRAVQIQPDCAEALSELRLINMRRKKSRRFIGRLFRR